MASRLSRSPVVHAGAGAARPAATGGPTIRAGAAVGAPGGGSDPRSLVVRIAGGGPKRLYIGGEAYGPTWTGKAAGNGSSSSAVVAALDWDGSVIWSWVDTTTLAADHRVRALCADSTGVYVVIVVSYTSWTLTKLDTTGAVAWGPVTGGSGAFSPMHIETNGSYVFASSPGAQHLWVFDAASGTVVGHTSGGGSSYADSAAAGVGSTGYAADHDSIHVERVQSFNGGGVTATATVYAAIIWQELDRTAQPLGYPGAAFALWIWDRALTPWGSPDTFDFLSTWPAGVWVEWGAVAYLSLQNGNIGHQPDISPTWWRAYNSSTDPVDNTWFMRKYAADLTEQGSVGFVTPTYASTSDGWNGFPAVDMTTGLVVTNIYDHPGGGALPTLVAYDSSGTEVWHVDDGTLWSGYRAVDVAAGEGYVVVINGDTYQHINILDAADGTLVVPQFTVGDDSTDWYGYYAVTIG